MISAMIQCHAIRSALVICLTSLIARPRHMMLMAGGFFVAGATLVVLLTIPAGLQRLAGHTGLDDVAVVLPASASDEASTSFSEPAIARRVSALPGIAKARDGHPLSAQQFVVNARVWKPDGTSSTVLVRGVDSVFWEVIGAAARWKTGRRFHVGINELAVGSALTRVLPTVHLGGSLRLRNAMWRVTGSFGANDGFWDSELWTDIAALQSAWNAPGQITAIWVKLATPDAFGVFKEALNSDPQLRGLQVIRQPDYYDTQVSFLRRFINFAALCIASVLGLGVLLSLTNALNISLYARRRELAVLRALGYRQGSLGIALLIETLTVGFICGVIALLAGRLILQGHEIGSSTSMQMIQFRMHVTPRVAVWTLTYLMLLGILSAPLPITRVLRTRLVSALQNE